MVSDNAGFCPGVNRAVNFAVEAAAQNDDRPLYMLGAIVHNETVVEDLLKSGVILANSVEEIEEGARVLVRAHGVSPEIEDALLERSCIIYDETCPFVKKIQRIVKEAAAENSGIIITGAANHPEVQGVIGYAGDAEVVILETAKEAEEHTFSDKKWTIVSQTTFSVDKWREICKILHNKIANYEIFDTICVTTDRRQSDASSLAANSDLMIVLGGRNSSNTAKLYEICCEQCEDTYWIDRPDQIPNDVYEKYLSSERIGITAGASTPEEMIREVIQNMTEKEGLTNQEQPLEELQEQPVEQPEQLEEPQEQLEEPQELTTEELIEEIQEETPEQPEVDFSEFIDNIPELKKGSIVKGRIVRYDEDYVYVDVRDKTEGRIPIREFKTDPDIDLEQACQEHMELDVYVRNIRSSDMGKEINLSKARVDFVKHKEQVEQAFKEKTPLTVKVIKIVRDGVITAYGSINIYIHSTQLELSRVENLEPYMDKTFDILVTQFDPNRRRLRVSGSRRSLLQRNRREKSREIWDTIEVGDVYEGVVRNLTNFGAFVDIGGVDGLVHISELSWQRVRHPSDVLSVNDVIEVHVMDFDRERKRISLGYRKKEDDPYADLEKRFPLGMIVRGVVVRMFPFGAFINIAPGVDALCHISQISEYRLNTPNEVLEEGMEVDARVVEVSDETRRVSVSIRDVEPINPDPDSEIVKRAEERKEQRPPRRRGKRQESDSDTATTYVDRPSSSSLSQLADFTAVTQEGSDLIESLKEATSEDKAEKTEVKEEATEVVEEAAEETVEEAAEEVVEEAAEEVVEEATEEVVKEATEEVVEEATEEAEAEVEVEAADSEESEKDETEASEA
ncbi:MAG: bifunctional 4-hydroxy-3-methylbut-2-enyl diphosphate reductase/30S ribosomal protein S1 [Eubacteriales bacterium]|nr:bifunctional 4-hydroxy-3-methylbut-2-enyl diphosphate reductase/30S ribosomal protein S1 [Eubacteriales bacterium]MDD3610805.1 bifunctional 4-hydroxy-3-methylbut-2-enyl diphosphate reductase/30S ribosomal protein S1 [Eubacteriales bacterium]